MSQLQNIQFKGINLHPNIADSSFGDCEEFINLKSENGNIRVDTDYEVVSADLPYSDIIVHIVGNDRMYVGKDSEGVVWFDKDTGEVLNRLYHTSHPDEVYLATTSNLLTISDTHTINTIVYRWINNAYELLFSGDINFDVHVSYTQGDVDKFRVTWPNTDRMDTSEVIKYLQSELNRVESENKNFAEGGFLMGFTLSLIDGNEVGPFNFRYVSIENDDSMFTDNGFVQRILPGVYEIYSNKAYRQIHLEIYKMTDLSKYDNIIKNVNLYVSQPISRLDLSMSGVNVVYNSDGPIADDGNLHVTIAEKSAPQKTIEKSLLYLNKSWSLSEFIELTDVQFISYDVVFGGDAQTTTRTMPVLNAHITRAGKMLAYNSRIHYYRSFVRLNIELPYLTTSEAANDYLNTNVRAYLSLKAEGKNIVQEFETYCNIKQTSSAPDIYLPEFIIVPDTRAFLLTIVYNGWVKKISLAPSPSYDYSYAYGEKNNGLMESGEAPIVTDNTYEERDIINVSAQNNPIFFPVNNSYRCQGNIITLGYIIEPLSEVRFGTDALYIFTDRGIYALSLGSGTVLYGNFDIVNSDVIDAMTQTRSGIIYAANGCVNVLNGRQTINISLPIEGKVDTSIKKSRAYSECCINDKLYNVCSLLSQVPFREYLRGAHMSYVADGNELIISNNNYAYSYVFSFIYSSWRKISGVYTKLRSNLLLRNIPKSSSSATQAQGEIVVCNAIVAEDRTFSTTGHARYEGRYTSGHNEKMALLVSDVQVSASLFLYPTNLAVIMSTLTKELVYMDDYYSNGALDIYYSLPLETGTTITLKNLTTGNVIFNVTLSPLNSIVTIPNKGIGEVITINNIPTRAVATADSVLTLASLISDTINSNPALQLIGNAANNTIDLTAVPYGDSGNHISVTIGENVYISTYVNPMSGGKEVTIEPGDRHQIIDRNHPCDVNRVVHIQTRPFAFADVYTTINRAVMYCRTILSQANNLSMYIFASNNLQDWQCVAASQKSGISIDHIRTSRSGKAYKYYTIMIGGYIYSNTEIGNVALEYTPKYAKKLR